MKAYESCIWRSVEKVETWGSVMYTSSSSSSSSSLSASSPGEAAGATYKKT
jgi:hypothetical protein